MSTVPQHHFDILRQRDVSDDPDPYGQIADAYFLNEMYGEALEVFSEMAEWDAVGRSRNARVSQALTFGGGPLDEYAVVVAQDRSMSQVSQQHARGQGMFTSG